MYARIRTREGQKPNAKTIKVLFDSGASATLIRGSIIKKLRRTKTRNMRWRTRGGTFHTEYRSKIQLSLPEFSDQKLITWQAYVDESSTDLNYDMIIGRDLLKELGIVLDFSAETMIWHDVPVPMKDPDATMEESYYVRHDQSDPEYDRVKHILDAKYDPADIRRYVEECTHLSASERSKLYTLLKEFEPMFDGTLGRWTGKPYHIELKPGVKPYYGKPYPIPKAYEQTTRMEVERLCKIGVLKRINDSEWGAPTFITPKKDGSVRFITDLREVNKRILRKPYPLPKIQDLLLKLEGFRYASSLDLNMGYYHIELSPFAKRVCTLVLPWGKYEYQRLPMGLCNSPDIFQEQMSDLMQGLEYVRAYIDDILCLTSGDYDDHLSKLREVLVRLRDAGLKVNIKKSFFAKAELEYLGYWITRSGISPLTKKVKAILKIEPPKTRKGLRSFIGLLNYYRDMWPKHSELLAPLSALLSNKVKYVWGEREQKAFNAIKRHVARKTLLTYPDFSRPFDIHTDASDLQLGAVISQGGKPIAFYSRKLQSFQQRYTTIEKELLSVVETLKEFRNILLGQRINVYTDHKNLTCSNFNTDRVYRWRLLLEEYGPNIHYVKGSTNEAADAMSRLAYADTVPQELHDFSADALPSTAFPLSYRIIEREQAKDKQLGKNLSNTVYRVKTFRGGGKTRTLICYSEKIAVPRTLQRKVIEWYHDNLCHPGHTRTEATIRQHFHWPTLREDVRKYCATCDVCQRTKKNKKKYGTLPEKVAETDPWEVLCVDLIGPYTIKQPNGNELRLWCVTMIDPATGWFEMARIPSKDAYTVADVVERTWFMRYPWPTKVIVDRGTEFLAEFADMIKHDFGATKKVITTRNPQANSIIERVHQTIGNMIRSFEINKSTDTDPWDAVLAATMFAVRTTAHTTLQATPAQLVFGRDAILNIPFEADWQLIKMRKQERIKKDNARENAKRIPHTYNVGDQVLVSADALDKFSTTPYMGPYEVKKVNTNGTLKLQMGAVLDTVNIRRIHPYKQR